MKKIRLRILPVLICFIFSAGICNIAFGQAPSETSSRLDSLYRSGSYEALENYALRSLLDTDSLALSDKAALYKYLGIVYILQGRETEGKHEFVRWLMIDRNGYIDPFRFPPEVMEVFRTAKAERDNRIEQYPVLALPIWKPTTSSTVKSLFVPGWGQIDKGNTTKGVLIFTAQAVTLTGWLVSENNFDIANKAYYRETEPEQFDSKYDRVNIWYQAKGTFLIASIAVYVFAQTDYFFFQEFVSAGGNRSLSFTFDSDPPRTSQNFALPSLTFSIRF